MRPRDVTFFFVFPAVFLSLVTSCSHTRSHHSGRYSDAPAGAIFLQPAPDFENSNFYARWSEATTEKEKIRYLLDRIGNSEHRFIRNGSIYSGKKARNWFLYKMKRWAGEAETARDFVDLIATFSRKTGKAYLVEFPDGKRYSLGSVLKNELLSFENFLNRIQTLAPGASPLPPRSPVSVALVQAAATATPRSNTSS